MKKRWRCFPDGTFPTCPKQFTTCSSLWNVHKIWKDVIWQYLTLLPSPHRGVWTRRCEFRTCGETIRRGGEDDSRRLRVYVDGKHLYGICPVFLLRILWYFTMAVFGVRCWLKFLPLKRSAKCYFCLIWQQIIYHFSLGHSNDLKKNLMSIAV